MKKTIHLLLLTFIVTSMSCSTDESYDTNTDSNNSSDTASDFDTNTQDISVENAVTIKFVSDDSISITNPYSSQITVVNDNSNITITSTVIDKQINYLLSGKTSNGSLTINSSSNFGLVLNGVSIISSDRPAINIASDIQSTITVVDYTNNRLIDGYLYSTDITNSAKASLFSNGSLTMTGGGNLQVTGSYKYAIASDKSVTINNGNITIKSSVSDGIHATSFLQLNDGVLIVNSTNDAIECDSGYITIAGGTITLTSTDGDGVKTSSKSTDVNRNIEMSGGNLTINISVTASKGLKSKGNIVLTGGDITVTSTGNAYYDTDEANTSSSSAIKADGDMTTTNTNITITSSGSGGKGINIDGALTFNGGNISVITTGSQYVYSSTVNTAAKAIKSTGNLIINSGTIQIKTSKTEAEGLESKSTIIINGGLIEIEAYDDCINATSHIEITGGTIYCVSETNDAIDSNGTMSISGGTIIAIGSSAPEAGFDCDENTFKITGGTLIGLAGTTSTPTTSVSTQNSVIYGGSSYETIHIESSDGTDLLTFKLPKTFTSTTMLFSSPSLTTGSTYTIFTGGAISGGTSSYGLYTGAVYSSSQATTSFTTSSVVTSTGTSSNNMGGRPNGR